MLAISTLSVSSESGNRSTLVYLYFGLIVFRVRRFHALNVFATAEHERIP